MTNSEKFQKVFGYYATEMWAKPEKEFLEWINSEALEYEPSEDLISKADVVKSLLLFKQSRKSVSRYDIGFEDGLSHAINILDLVPLVYIPSINIDAEPVKYGEWITNKDGYSKCSECGFSFGCIVCPHEETDFCPNCGAKMDKDCEERKEP